VVIPPTWRGNVVDLVARLESLEITPDAAAKVILDERTGTIVMGENVRISTVAVSHGNLSIQIREQPQVSQPLPFSEGQTKVVPDTQISVEEEQKRLFVVEGGRRSVSWSGSLTPLASLPET
jgi:flagellar P-ring protein precursor FlgI